MAKIKKRKKDGCPRDSGRSACVCVCLYKHRSVETPYLAIALPPLLGVLLVLLQGGLGLPLQAEHLPLALLDQAVLLCAVLLL